MIEKGKSKARVSPDSFFRGTRGATSQADGMEGKRAQRVSSSVEHERTNLQRNHENRGVQGSMGPSVAMTTNGGRSWVQVVQGSHWFRWEMSRAMVEDIPMLGEHFTKVITFSKEDVS